MTYYLKFISFLGLLLLFLFFTGWQIRLWSLNRPLPPFPKTELIQRLTNELKGGKAPQVWEKWKDPESHSKDSHIVLKISYEKKKWVVSGGIGKQRELESVFQESSSGFSSGLVSPTGGEVQNQIVKNSSRFFEGLSENLPKPKILLIQIQSSSRDLSLRGLQRILRRNERWKNVLICSRMDGFLKDLKRLEPNWSFCNGEIFMTRFLTLASLGLESLLSIDSDVFFVHLKNISLNPGLVPIMKEAKRQNKLVFAGPGTKIQKSYPVDFWVLEN